MIKSLKNKIFLSFLLLILMFVAAGIMSIIEFKKMGNSVDEVLTNNYQSIESAKIMLDAVEREDSGVLMWLLGNRRKGEETIVVADTLMKSALIKARDNISETNEEQHILHIEEEYAKFNTLVHKIIADTNSTDQGFTDYETVAKDKFFNTKNAINQLMVLNQNQMYKQSTLMKENSQRAMMPAIISIIIAVIFAALLYIFISIYFIQPIHRLIKEVKFFYPEKKEINAKINSNDEIKTLENEINQLIRRNK